MDRFTINMVCRTNPPCISWGSILHGMLVEHVPDEWKERMHDDRIRPIAQWVEVKGDTSFCWHLNVLNDELGECLGHIILPNAQWECKHLKTKMDIQSVFHESLSFYDYMKPFFKSSEATDRIILNFRTPTTHKTQGHYAVFPAVDLIANNLVRRICDVSPDFALEDQEALEQVIEYTRITRYNLNSMRYALEGAWLTGYMGSMELRFGGPDSLKRLAGVLFGFASWSGVGIKTALGMGGCNVIIPERIER